MRVDCWVLTFLHWKFFGSTQAVLCSFIRISHGNRVSSCSIDSAVHLAPERAHFEHKLKRFFGWVSEISRSHLKKRANQNYSFSMCRILNSIEWAWAQPAKPVEIPTTKLKVPCFLICDSNQVLLVYLLLQNLHSSWDSSTSILSWFWIISPPNPLIVAFPLVQLAEVSLVWRRCLVIIVERFLESVGEGHERLLLSTGQK